MLNFFSKNKEKPDQPRTWLSRLSSGLAKSSGKISDGITGIFTKRTLDDVMLEELEELLISTDLGVKTTSNIIKELARTKVDKEITADEVKALIAMHIATILAPVATPLTLSHTPEVILVCGVNGNGKTTTIGKLAHQFRAQGKKVVLVACDTFRAAAVEQLAVWAERAGCQLVTGKPEADPASVAFTALERAKNEAIDIVLIDTAGRLHNKANLMEELAKIVRVIKKSDDSAPHHTLLVLDATTGQNAHNQAKEFGAIAALTGLIVTKLDGTAKGGVVVSLAAEFALPVHAIGVGEAIEDLHPFEAQAFAERLVGIEPGKSS